MSGVKPDLPTLNPLKITGDIRQVRQIGQSGIYRRELVAFASAKNQQVSDSVIPSVPLLFLPPLQDQCPQFHQLINQRR
jgi:hypothetical protein